MKEFNLHIEMGNELMSSPCDVSWALMMVAEKIDKGQRSGAVTDINGNKVGTFRLE